ncbi:conserved hypothetical protein [Ruegeria lacuscaerulensis ITI-1157]|nr:conserved hypothetical protein [Ruegeria lacuscaerulensis ITI-1157]SHJ52147.1 Uncharacterized membrane protein [Ruegeria lacuscaerulensis ITI-1157]
MIKLKSISKPQFLFRRISRQLWVRTSLIAALAVVSAGVGTYMGSLVPDFLVQRLSTEAVAKILGILASSMLAVTTFSLSIMVAAQRWASNQSSPRAQQVIEEDSVSQNVLATFLGAFIFALVSLILIETNVYTQQSIAVALAFTLAVIFLVTLALLVWIDQLPGYGSISETAQKIEKNAADTMARAIELPCLGAIPYQSETAIPQAGHDVCASSTGNVRHIDVGMLNACAEENDCEIWILALPGQFVAEGEPLAKTTRKMDSSTIREAFVIGTERNFDQDPRFGVQTLSEIAQRALSPGVNDPMTAVQMVESLLRVLLPLGTTSPQTKEPRFPRVHAPEIPIEVFLRDAYAAISRDAGNKVEVHEAVLDALARLALRQNPSMATSARAAAKQALSIAERDLTLEADKLRVREIASRSFSGHAVS